MAKQPYIPFYIGDYIKDTRVLPLNVKGAWVDLLLAMWENDPKGELTGTVEDFARIINSGVEEAIFCLTYLKLKKIFTLKGKIPQVVHLNRTDKVNANVTGVGNSEGNDKGNMGGHIQGNGEDTSPGVNSGEGEHTFTIISRKQKRMDGIARKRREAGARGGNPNLTGNQYNSPGFVFVIRRENDGLIKIGYSSSPNKRIYRIKGQFPGVIINLIHSQAVEDMAGEALKASLLFEHKRVGDWYDLTEKDLKDLKVHLNRTDKVNGKGNADSAYTSLQGESQREDNQNPEYENIYIGNTENKVNGSKVSTGEGESLSNGELKKNKDIGVSKEIEKAKPVENVWTGMPGEEYRSMVLPEKNIEILQRHYFNLKKNKIEKSTILELWEIFKLQYLDGTNHYPNKKSVSDHFVNLTRKQNFITDNSNQNAKFKNNSRPGSVTPTGKISETGAGQFE